MDVNSSFYCEFMFKIQINECYHRRIKKNQIVIDNYKLGINLIRRLSFDKLPFLEI